MSLIKQLIPNEKDNFSFLGNNATFSSTFNYLTSNGTGGIKYNKNIKIENEVSFSIWFKVNNFLYQISENNSKSTGMHLIDMRTSDTEGYQPIYIDESKIQYHVGNSRKSFEFSTSFETGKWYHLCIRAKNEAGKIECWLNGEKLSGTFTDNPLPIQGEFPLHIGNRHSNSSEYFLDGQIKDVRIYNHWVSDYEIKELSKGLCCHYSFDDASNLLINAEKYTKNSPLVRQGSYKDNWELSDMQCELIPNQTYIFQFKCNGNYSAKHYVNEGTGVDPSNRLCAVWFYLDKDDTPTYAFYIPKSDVKDGPNGCKYYIYKNTDGYKYLKIRTNAYSNGTSQITINFWDFKLTLGDQLTTWTPYSSAYKISDNSGFNNNSTKVNNVGVTSSKIGPGAGLFNGVGDGTSSYVALPTSCKIDPPFTYNVWAYMSDWTSLIGKTILSCTQGGGYGLFGGLFGEEKVESLIFESYNKSSATYIQIAKALSAPELSDGWHMFTYLIDVDVVDIDGTATKIYPTEAYIDGQSIGSITNNNFAYSESSNTIFLGGEAGADTKTPDPLTNCFNGKIDDFRLYSSILSPEDIKDLYNCRCVIDNNHNMKASSYKEENSTFNINSNGTIECTDFVENEYLYTKDGAKFLKIFEHDVRKYPEFFKNNDEAKKFVGKNRFSRLIDLSDSSFKSIAEDKYEFILKYLPTENGIFDFAHDSYKDTGFTPDFVNNDVYIEMDVIVPDDSVDKRRLIIGNFQEQSVGAFNIEVNEDNKLRLYIGHNSSQSPFLDLVTDTVVNPGKYKMVFIYHEDDCSYSCKLGNISIEGKSDYFKQISNQSSLYIGAKDRRPQNNEFEHIKSSMPIVGINRWKQKHDPNTYLSTSEGYESIFLTMTKQWNGRGIGLSNSKGVEENTYLECQSATSGWYGAIGQTKNAYYDGFPSPDASTQKHVQLWVRVDNTNYNKSGNSISKSIVNQYMKFDNSTPAINTGITLTSNSKVSVSFKCNSDMNRGCIVFGQGALEQLNNTFEMYVWQLGSEQQIQLNIGKENTTQGISNFTANTVYSVDVYGDGRYVINGVEGNISRTCGSDTLANTCLIGAIHRKQSGSDSYTEYKTITDGVATWIDKFEIWEKDGNGDYSILKYRYYSPQYICTADNFIED